MGHEFNDTAASMLVDDLAAYPEADVLAALKRCRAECKRKLTLSDILDRLPHSHPGPEEAWALVSSALGNESVSIVWTDEMAEAMGVARHLDDDHVAARLAFKETYERLVADARLAGRRPHWRVSLGFDPHGRDYARQECDRKNAALGHTVTPALPDLRTGEVALPVKELIGRIGRSMPSLQAQPQETMKEKAKTPSVIPPADPGAAGESDPVSDPT